MATLCRDCLALFDGQLRRCDVCASPRLVVHAQLAALSIAHVDCDAFYAAVEKRDNPALADVPLIIGGGTRGVVSTACYIARIAGVRSAMPMFKARALCPDAVVLPPNMRKYAGVGREVRQLMQTLTPLVEPISIDEAFLDLSGTQDLHGGVPARTLADFARRVEREIGITVSIGLSNRKFLAKIASDLDKPRGFSVLSHEEAPAFLAPRPVSFLWGVGKSLAERLKGDGLRTIGDLQKLDHATLHARYGAMGGRLAALSHGEDARRVDPDQADKSISAETTFDTNLRDQAGLEAILWRLSEKVAQRLKEKSLAGQVVTLKLKSADFKQRTRSRHLADATNLAHRIDEVARDLLAPECDGTRYRLIGVGLSDLCAAAHADPLDLIEPKRDKQKRAEGALDSIRARFGQAAIHSGRALRDQK